MKRLAWVLVFVALSPTVLFLHHTNVVCDVKAPALVTNATETQAAAELFDNEHLPPVNSTNVTLTNPDDRVIADAKAAAEAKAAVLKPRLLLKPKLLLKPRLPPKPRLLPTPRLLLNCLTTRIFLSSPPPTCRLPIQTACLRLQHQLPGSSRARGRRKVVFLH